MPARLIVNADDFGLTPGINEVIAELYQAGVVSSATLMARGSAFDHAVKLARANPGLGIGCHVVFTDGLPVSAPERIPTLLAADGQSLRPVLRDFLIAVLRGRVRVEQMRDEAVAQIQVLQKAGIHVMHLDTHKHTHVLPQVAGALLQAAEITGVRAVRNPFEAAWSLRFGYTRPFRLMAVVLTRLLRRSFLRQPAIRSGRVLTSRGTVGISATGRLNEPTLRQLIAALHTQEGTWELVCHPGHNDADLDRVQTRLRNTREIERHALLRVLSPAPERPQSTEAEDSSHLPLPELIHYGRLVDGGLAEMDGTSVR